MPRKPKLLLLRPRQREKPRRLLKSKRKRMIRPLKPPLLRLLLLSGRRPQRPIPKLVMMPQQPMRPRHLPRRLLLRRRLVIPSQRPREKRRSLRFKKNWMQLPHKLLKRKLLPRRKLLPIRPSRLVNNRRELRKLMPLPRLVVTLRMRSGPLTCQANTSLNIKLSTKQRRRKNPMKKKRKTKTNLNLTMTTTMMTATMMMTPSRRRRLPPKKSSRLPRPRSTEPSVLTPP